MKRNISNSNNHRGLSNGQRGEVYEVNGDQVAVIFDPSIEKSHDAHEDVTSKEENGTATVYWVDCMPLLCISVGCLILFDNSITLIPSDFFVP